MRYGAQSTAASGARAGGASLRGQQQRMASDSAVVALQADRGLSTWSGPPSAPVTSRRWKISTDTYLARRSMIRRARSIAPRSRRVRPAGRRRRRAFQGAPARWPATHQRTSPGPRCAAAFWDVLSRGVDQRVGGGRFLALGVLVEAVSLEVGDSVAVDGGVRGELAADGEPVDAGQFEVDRVGAVFGDGCTLRLGGAGHGRGPLVYAPASCPMIVLRAARKVLSQEDQPLDCALCPMPQTPHPTSVGRARATSVRPLADVDLLIQLAPLPGASPRATLNILHLAAIQLHGKLIRNGIVESTPGSGKTQSLGVLLRSALVFSDAKTALDEAQDQRATTDLAWRLLSSAEKDTRLPSITTPVSGSTTIWGAGLLPAPDELAEASEVVALFWLVAVDLLTEHLAPHHYELGSHPPPHGSSPCGVIGLSAPRVPRAPGGPADLPVPSHMCVLAA